LKKKETTFKLEEEYELTDTYEVLKLELDNTTLTKEILTKKHSMRTTKSP
jgi:hypothetical protein